MGRMPRTRNPPDTPATNTMTPELTWNEARILGARTAKPELCRLSRATMMASTKKVVVPDLRRPSRREVRSSRVPGSRCSGSRISSAACAALCRSWAESARRRPRSAALSGPSVAGTGGTTAGISLTAAPTPSSGGPHSEGPSYTPERHDRTILLPRHARSRNGGPGLPLRSSRHGVAPRQRARRRLDPTIATPPTRDRSSAPKVLRIVHRPSRCLGREG
jgi:hypothetical protein